MHDVTIFTNSHFCRLHGDNHGIIFKNFNFKTRFEKNCCRVNEWQKTVLVEKGVIENK